MIRAIEDGLYQPSMKERMAALEAEKAQLVAELAVRPDAHADRPAPQPAGCSTGRKVEELEAAAGRPGARARRPWTAIRAMITPDRADAAAEQGGMDAVLEGDLAPDPDDLRRAPNAGTPAG